MYRFAKQSFVLIFSLVSYSLLAQDSTTLEIPEFGFLRATEDYNQLKDWNRKGWQQLKYIPLSEKSYLSIGGDWRSEGQFLFNEDWVNGNNDMVLYQRYMLHTDWHLGKHFRIFGQLKSGVAFGRNGDPLPFDVDYLDTHQLYVQFRFGKSTIDLGRQELVYGSRRLISIREGTNVRQSFDGIRWYWKNEHLRIDILAYTYNPQQIGFFDNTIDFEQQILGSYLTWQVPAKYDLGFDFYYLAYRNEHPNYEAGSELEIRHSVGFRHYGQFKKLIYNNEAVFQFGQFGRSSILAWTVSTDLKLEWSPKFNTGLKAEIISGDQWANDNRLGTFNAMYPRGGYFGLLALVGPANLMDIHPSIHFSPIAKLNLNFDWDFFWRYSINDGIYFPSGRIRETSQNSTTRFIGHQLGFQVGYSINRFIEVESSYFLFYPGAFIQNISEGKPFSQIGISIYCKI
ncbi:MAG: alginate export family protein [Saprospiraceae bacterium]|nr:alginate export family protein [Saprospiraceae bacterium]